MMETTLETELNRIVYEKIVREEYPAPATLVSDAEQRQELADLRAGTIDRPSTKLEYVNRLAQLEAQIKDIAAQNKQIELNNEIARKTIDYKYINDIAAAKLDEANIWKAIRNYRNYLLFQCDWTQLPYNSLSEEMLTAWKTYRKQLRDLPQTFVNSNDVVFPVKP